MAVYIIGDIQGCHKKLKKLLKLIKFSADRDILWFVGDLVNRGPDSLKTLRFVQSLGDNAVTVLGNHDLHLLAVYHLGIKQRNSDTLNDILEADDCAQLMEWLRHRPLMHIDPDVNFAMVHAGIYPGWTLSQARNYAAEVEQTLQGVGMSAYLRHMYGDEPTRWSENLEGMERLRFFTNVFTRMRYLTPELDLDLTSKGAPGKYYSAPVNPWFEFSQAAIKHNRIAFGHWSTLPPGRYGNCFALDSGCLWGGELTALQIDKKIPRRFIISCEKLTKKEHKSVLA